MPNLLSTNQRNDDSENQMRLLVTDRSSNDSTRQYRFADGLVLVCATDMAPRLKTPYGALSRTISRTEASRRLRLARVGVEAEVEAPLVEEAGEKIPAYSAARVGRPDF